MGYAVDLDLLDLRIRQLEAFEKSLDAGLDSLERTVADLHGTWSGLAAQAQRDAHRRWVAGAREMRIALAGLRAAAQVAHANYQSAIAANLAMWESTR